MLVTNSIKDAPALDLTEFGPFLGFLIHNRGLPSLQPTLLWRVKFTSANKSNSKKLDEIIYTDSITVPGESISTNTLDLNPHSIQYLVSDGRSTTNTLSIGFYVDIYSTIERVIYPWMKKISLFGAKNDNRIDINLYGFRMGASPKSDDAIVAYGYDDKLKRPCYKHYKFVGCFPTSVPEYTYDQTNQKWANVRTITFGFSDYDVELLPMSELAVKGTHSKFETGDLDHDIDSQGKKVNKRITEKEVTEPIAKEGGHSLELDRRPSELGIPIKKKGSAGTTKDYIEPIEAASYMLGTDLSDKDAPEYHLPDSIDFELMNDSKAIERSKKTPNNGHKHIEPKAPNWGFASASEKDGTPNIDSDYDTTKQYMKADGFIKDFIKTLVKGYITPDTPIYHGLRAPLSKAIRKVEQWFYTEPKNKSVPVFDHTEINSRSIGEQIRADADDHVDVDSHDTGKQVDIEVLDYAAIHNHAKADSIKAPENDYMNHIASQKDSADRPIVVDRNDYVTSYGDADVKIVDPDDNKIKYSSESVRPDPNDKRTGGAVSADEVVADKNDFVNVRSVSIDNVIPDSNDASIDKISVPEIFAEDDVPNVDSIKINSVEVNENDHNVNTPRDINQKEIDERDHVDFSDSGAKKTLGNGNSTVDTGTIDIKNYKPPMNTLPVHNKKKSDDEEDYIKFATPATAKTPNSDSIDVEEYVPASNDINLDHDQDKVKKIYSQDDTPVAASIKVKDVMLSKKDSIIKHGLDLIDDVLPDKNDLLVKHKDIATTVEPDNDSITTHHKEISKIDTDKNDYVNASNIAVNVAKIDKSIIDFAKLVSNKIKTEESDRIKQHEEVKLSKRDNDESIVTHENVGNIIAKPIEPQAVGTNRNMGKYVDPHEDDHTRIEIK